jgi:Flp pilus assembly protein TadD
MARFRTAHFLVGILVFAALARGLAAQSQQGQSGSILGEIRVERGDAPPNRVEVILQTHGLVADTRYSDSTGRFSFTNLDVNLYHVIIQEEGYEPVDIQVSVNPLFSSMNLVNVTLRPKAKARVPGEKTVAGGNPNLVGSAEYKQHYPKNAVKQFEQGVKAERRNKMDEAMRHYQRAIELAPEFYAARNNLGLAYMARQDFGNAQAQFERVISINPADTEAYFNLGNILLLTNDLPKAGRVVHQGLQRQPDSAFGKFLLGSIYSRTGNRNDAEKLFSECLQLDPGMSKAHLGLVNLYLQEKRMGDAVAQLKAFLKSAPADPLAPQARQVLSRLEKGASDTSSQ